MIADNPRPPDVQALIERALNETDHVIQFKEDGWMIAHPLMERLDGSLFDCEMRWDADDPGVRGKFFLLAPNCIGGEA